MRDKTFDGTWSTHKFFGDNTTIKIIRRYDSFIEKGDCEWSGSENKFGLLREWGGMAPYTPYLRENKSISYSFYSDTEKLFIRFDNSKPKEITSDLSFSEWSRYKKLRLRTEKNTTGVHRFATLKLTPKN